MQFNSQCQECSRLATFLTEIKEKHPSYYCAPVPSFGDTNARLLIVGLAPGMHGANATGRPFTGDHAGIILYQTLYDFGFSNQPVSVSTDDDLKLKNCRITNAVKCLPPANKPKGEEIRQCNHFLQAELKSLPGKSIVLALGKIAHDAVVRACGRKLSEFRFAHAAEHQPNEKLILLDSYHCSRYNTQTKRLTTEMFASVFARARELIRNN
ncbi:MAG TPA: uracil-DNA glycosylase [Chromatiales bacterium]|nr:uracil-DNA glycosylase [Thiotrichales bacterium]HIP67498.1 uracil-DNA glycosylase [Chromatiales bacterium]